MKLNLSKLIIISLYCFVVSCVSNSEPKHTLVITDDCGSVRGCATIDELMKIANTVISARPDIFCLDAASPDNVNYRSKRAFFKYGGRFDTLYAQGYNPYGIIVDSIKAHGITFLANIRMNDHHGRMHQWAPWSREHKEWSLGTDDGDRGWRTVGSLRQMDYSIKEVREYRLATLTEITEMYPIDGFQLDFIRNVPLVSEPKAEKAKYLTAYIRSVRQLLDETAKKNNRGHLLLGVILPWDYDFCVSEGLELKKWVDEGLVDYFSPDEWYYANWNISLDKWKELLKDSPCKLYPSTMGNVSPYQVFEHGEPSLLGDDNKVLDGPKIRAIADNYMAQQPDGFAFYNFYPQHFGEYYPYVREWTDPRQTKNMEKQYFIGRKTLYAGTEWDNFDEGKAYAFVRDSLVNKGDRAEFKFRFSTPTENVKIHFRMVIKYLTDADQVKVRMNGDDLTNAKWEYKTVECKGEEIPAAFLSCDLNGNILLQGENVLSAELLTQPSVTIQAGEYELCTEPL